jgi:hypothetical protein
MGLIQDLNNKTCDLPSGKHTKSYGKSPFIVNFPMKKCDVP